MQFACRTGAATDEREEDVFEAGLLLDVLDLGGWEELFEFGQRAVGDDPALVQDRDPVRELLGLIERQPSLEDIFLALVGHRTRTASTQNDNAAAPAARSN